MPADSSVFRETSLICTLCNYFSTPYSAYVLTSLICTLCNYFSTLYSAYVLTNTVNHVVSLAH